MSLTKEIREIIASYDRASAQGKRTALATVVDVEGSSYRRPGARMLITEEGELTGAISGGCLEGDALRKALLVIMQDDPMLVTYDTSDEDDAIFGVGLGCNGIIRVLIEPVSASSEPHPVALLRQLAADRQSAVLLTLFSLEDHRSSLQGTQLLVKEAEVHGNTGESLMPRTILPECYDVLKMERSVIYRYQWQQEEIHVFLQFVPPAISLVIAGAGNDIFPVVDMAGLLGWDVTLADGRPDYASKQRFASCNIVIGEPEKVLEHIAVDQRTAVLLMTHNYNYDKALLRQLLVGNVPYIGMLGPEKKRMRMLEELREEGMEITGVPANVFSPVGLDIAAETSEEIALSAIAEIKAVFHRKQGGHLRDIKGSIHRQDRDIKVEVVKT